MTQTSDNFRASMAGNMTELRAARDIWIQVNGPLATAVSTADKALKNARTAAATKILKQAQSNKTKAPVKDELAAEIDKDDDVKAAVTKLEEAKTAQDVERAKVLATMKKVFAPWVKQLEGEVTSWKAVDVEDVKAKKLEVDKAKDREALIPILEHAPLAVIWNVAEMKQIAKFGDLQKAMSKRLGEMSKQDWRTKQYYSEGEIKTRVELIRRLTSDANKVFGVVQGGKIPLTVNNPAVMQILERGFARHDELRVLTDDQKADPKKIGPLREVFNKEFVAAMFRFGFGTGATWSTVDTMHFDFMDGLASVDASLNMGGDYGPKPD
jgi:hypothetical protein